MAQDVAKERLPAMLTPGRLDDTLNDEASWRNTVRLLMNLLVGAAINGTASSGLADAIFSERVLDLGDGRLRAWSVFALLFEGNTVVEVVVLANSPSLFSTGGWSVGVQKLLEASPQIKVVAIVFCFPECAPLYNNTLLSRSHRSST
jgi:hypothetical protein